MWLTEGHGSPEQPHGEAGNVYSPAFQESKACGLGLLLQSKTVSSQEINSLPEAAQRSHGARQHGDADRLGTRVGSEESQALCRVPDSSPGLPTLRKRDIQNAPPTVRVQEVYVPGKTASLDRSTEVAGMGRR